MQSSYSDLCPEVGPQDAPAIVFLHGGGSGGWMWQAVTAALPEYRCLTPDLPEHGVHRGVGPFSMQLAAECVAQMIHERAPGGQAVVVGLSEGAQAVVQLLAQEPGVVRKAIISSALLRPVRGLGWLNSPALLRWTYKLAVAPLRGSDGWIRLNMKYSAGIPDAYFAQFKKDFQEMTESGFVNVMIANQTYRLPEGLKHAAAPTLVLAGTKEYGAMKQSARDLAAALPCARLGWVGERIGATMAAQHNWALTAPEVFSQTVRSWVEDRDLPEGIEPA